jgi:hypothetical protein
MFKFISNFVGELPYAAPQQHTITFLEFRGWKNSYSLQLSIRQIQKRIC